MVLMSFVYPGVNLLACQVIGIIGCRGQFGCVPFYVCNISPALLFSFVDSEMFVLNEKEKKLNSFYALCTMAMILQRYKYNKGYTVTT